MLSLLVIFLVGAIAYAVALISGGGGSLLVVALLTKLLPLNEHRQIPSLINFSETIVRPYRLALFWKEIDWEIVKHYVPAAVVGTWLGAWSLSWVNLGILKTLVALFLLSAPLQYWLTPTDFVGKAGSMRLEWFAPLGLITSYLSALVGCTGPIENPFYFNYGTKSLQMVATKTANSFVNGIIRMLAYWNFGLFHPGDWSLALALTGGELAGTFLGRRALERIDERVFRKISYGTMMIIGLSILLS